MKVVLLFMIYLLSGLLTRLEAQQLTRYLENDKFFFLWPDIPLNDQDRIELDKRMVHFYKTTIEEFNITPEVKQRFEAKVIKYMRAEIQIFLRHDNFLSFISKYRPYYIIESNANSMALNNDIAKLRLMYKLDSVSDAGIKLINEFYQTKYTEINHGNLFRPETIYKTKQRLIEKLKDSISSEDLIFITNSFDRQIEDYETWFRRVDSTQAEKLNRYLSGMDSLIESHYKKLVSNSKTLLYDLDPQELHTWEELALSYLSWVSSMENKHKEANHDNAHLIPHVIQSAAYNYNLLRKFPSSAYYQGYTNVRIREPEKKQVYTEFIQAYSEFIDKLDAFHLKLFTPPRYYEQNEQNREHFTLINAILFCVIHLKE